ncbi:MAG: hypothetical protein WC073_02560 [Sterolibacterium sp.]
MKPKYVLFTAMLALMINASHALADESSGFYSKQEKGVATTQPNEAKKAESVPKAPDKSAPKVEKESAPKMENSIDPCRIEPELPGCVKAKKK